MTRMSDLYGGFIDAVWYDSLFLIIGMHRELILDAAKNLG